MGRAVDRLGQWRVLVPCAVAQATALGALVLCTEAARPLLVLLLCGFVAGAGNPPTSSILRSAWPWLLADRPDLLQGAYAIDTMIIEAVLIAGPLIVGVIAALTSPAAALVALGGLRADRHGAVHDAPGARPRPAGGEGPAASARCRAQACARS